MELDYAFLADRASRSQDGRLFVFGGDIDNVEAAGFPALLQCTLVARMLLYPHEDLDGHNYAIDFTSPSGERKRILEPQPLNTLRGGGELPSGSGLTVSLTLGIRSPGHLLIHLIVDDREMKTFTVAVASPRAEGPVKQEEAR